MEYRRRRIRRSKRPNVRKKRVKKTPKPSTAITQVCKWCGALFSSMYQRTYCSIGCQTVGHRLRGFLKLNEKLLKRRFTDKELKFVRAKSAENMVRFYLDELHEFHNNHVRNFSIATRKRLVELGVLKKVRHRWWQSTVDWDRVNEILENDGS